LGDSLLVTSNFVTGTTDSDDVLFLDVLLDADKCMFWLYKYNIITNKIDIRYMLMFFILL
jgi:hypothetical protein